jgi:hypothetical protein
MRAGLSTEIDAVEQARQTPEGSVGPVHVGVLQSLAASPGFDLDPAVTIGARDRFVRRLGREPSQSELAQEIRAFDIGIAAANAAGASIVAPSRPTFPVPARPAAGADAGGEAAGASAIQALMLSLIRTGLEDEQSIAPSVAPSVAPGSPPTIVAPQLSPPTRSGPAPVPLAP